MADSKLTAAQERALFSIRLLQEAQAARERYDATGVLQDAEEVAPCINTLWVTVRSALGYVRPLVTSTQQLPKKFEFAGLTFRLIFPPEGLVQIIEPTTETNLTAGFIGWADPMTAAPLNAAALPPTQPDQS